MFENFFKNLIQEASSVNEEAIASQLVKESDLYSVFFVGKDKRSQGAAKFSSSVAVPGDPKDIARLILLGKRINPIVVLEIGSGFSTGALSFVVENSKKYLASNDFPNRNEQSFIVESLDESELYIQTASERLPDHLKKNVRFHHSTVSCTKFNGRHVTLFDDFPNCLPDFIYLDGPSQKAASIGENGFTIDKPFRMPMSADLLSLEHFLEPGCLILVDGRTANARFLKSNFQRSWLYEHDTQSDVHYFMMDEAPLGSINMAKLKARGLLC